MAERALNSYTLVSISATIAIANLSHLVEGGRDLGFNFIG
jgi:hypothetical protein